MPRRKIERDPIEKELIKRQRQDKRNADKRSTRSNSKKNSLYPKIVKTTRIHDLDKHDTILLNKSDFIDHPSTSRPPPVESSIRDESLTRNVRGYDSDGNSELPVDEINIGENYLGPMSLTCSHCTAKHFSAEQVANKKHSFNDCCSHGEVALDDLPDVPVPLKHLFDGSDEKSHHFFERIRYYNSSFSFVSFNANLVQFRNSRTGPFCFKLQGQVYYQINESLYPEVNENPTNGQLFIIDANEASQFRCTQNNKLDLDVVSTIETVIREQNIFVHSYQMMKDELDSAKTANDNIEPELQLLFTLKKGMDRGRYNFQRVNEVAAVFATTADGDIPESSVTIRNKTTKQLKSISTMDFNVEPWIYPLFYPHGSKGWHKDLPCVRKNKHVTRNAYIKFRMAIRNSFNAFLMGRRLFQQWVVDSYVKVEKDRISFCRNNKKKLRAESYQGLIDHLHNRATDTNSQIGKIIILPSTFVSSPRNMVQHYQDAMCLVRVFGTPDLFITMTCNPQWCEIVENLLPGQTAADRPDIVARVFYLKVKQLIDIIVKQNHFGEVKAFVYVIEYQKRGLPHVHLLVTLNDNSKITTPEQVNRYVSAEIPDPLTNPRLHGIVMKNMIHGPCGDWCLVNNTCSKKYPKPHVSETTMNENGYPQYGRRNTNISYLKGNNYEVDNRHVVPHNRKLLLLLNCHINVEIVASVESVKYLFKYVYKGHDASAFDVTNSDQNRIVNHDEIKDFLEGRYVGPVEACWRILNKELHNKSHTVIRLPVHLPNQHTITIDPENTENIQNALEKETMLIDYFALNARDPEARNLFYSEIPSHYVFKKKR
ncbi:uncharacterized protein LOC141534044 [Cotesia typhae]|uniref:uncharacterized protein LOC141534044 n=1 Tax=Cotesia typhae TaxID=2053667 RepID=UPI003D684BDA